MLGGGSAARQAAADAIDPGPCDDRGVGTPKKPRSRGGDPLSAYRRIRKPMPPPEKVIADKRRKLEAEEAEREAREER
jgi:hypothetical protein